MLALTLLAHATLLVADAALQESRLLGDAVRARRAARSGLEVALHRPWSAPPPPALSLPGELALELRREGPGPLGLMTMEALARTRHSEIAARQVAWGLQPRAWLDSWPAWVTTRVPAGHATASRLARVPTLPCPALTPRARWRALPAAGPVPPSVARLDSAELRRRLGGTGRRWYPGPVAVIGDTLTGVIATPGQLRVPPGAVVRGLLLAGGDVILEPGSEVAGLIQSGGRLELVPGARLTLDPCGALDAVAGASELLRPLPLPGAMGFVPGD
jgi:hypothetical protein